MFINTKNNTKVVTEQSITLAYPLKGDVINSTTQAKRVIFKKNLSLGFIKIYFINYKIRKNRHYIAHIVPK
jgi:hypothetical protein